MRFKKLSVKTYIDDVELAYAAGFFDGEGTFAWRGDKLAHISVAQKDTTPLLKLKKMFGVGKIYTYAYQPVSYYVVNGRLACGVIEKILPYLVVKRESALKAVASKDTIRVVRHRIRSYG
jgi:hypothetical protein